jgi:protein-disulfide isomerase
MKPCFFSLAFLAILSACTADGVQERSDAGPVLCPIEAGGTPAAHAVTDSVIHDYLTAHPEVLIEMSQALRQHQQAAQEERIKQGSAAVFADGTDPVGGDPAGDVTIVEWFDGECPFCKRLAPEVRRLLDADPHIRIVYKEFPILGAGSTAAAQAAFAAMEQGKYEAFHNAIMADTTPEHQLALPRILEIAKSVGLDVTRLKADMPSPKIAAKIAADVSLARSLGITGTPTVLVGGKLLPGAPSFQALSQAVADARAGR